MLEVWTLGGGEYLVNVFNAVAAWTGGGGYRSMLQVVFVMGLAYSLFVVAFSLDWRAWLNWFIQATAIYMMLLVPTVTVKVTDRIDPGLSPAVVANVPLGLGVMASFTSQLGDWMTETAETVFVMPAALQMNTKGVIYGARLMEKAQTFEIADPVFAANMDEHFKQCVFYDILLGFKDMRDITSSNNIWAAVGTGSPARAQKWIERTGFGTTESYVMRCDQAYAALNSQWTTEIDASLLPFARSTYPKLAEAAAVARLKNDIPQVAAAMHGTSTDPYAYLQQVSTMSAFMAARESFSDAGWDAYAAQRADAQARNTYTSIAQQAMTWVPLLGIVLQVVFYAMFPVIFPLFLFPRTGITTLKGYATGFFYLASWGPLYVILHMFVMNRAASAYAAVAPQGMTLLVGNGIEAVNNDIATVAGFLMMSVPFLAAGMARGAMAIAGHATSMLAPAQGAAEAAAVERTTGNYAYGNTSFQNLTSNMRQANKWDDRPHIGGGYASSSYTHADGGIEHGFASGAYSYDTRTGISNIAVTPTRTGGFDAAVSQTLSEGQAHVDRLSNTASESWQATAQTATDLLRSAEHRVSSGTETGSSLSNSMSRMNTVSENLSSRLSQSIGLTEAESREVANVSQITGSADAGIAVLAEKWGLRGRADVAAKLASIINETTGRRVSADQAYNEIRDITSSEINSSEARSARDDFSRQSSSSSDAQVRSLSERMATSITDSRSASREAARSEETFERLSNDLRESSSRGYSLNQNESQEFVTYANERLLSDPLLASVGWSPRMVMPNTAEQRQVRDILLGDFVARRINEAREEMGLAVPDSLTSSLQGPELTNGSDVRAWGERNAAAVRGDAPAVTVRPNSGNLEVAVEVADRLQGGEARVSAGAAAIAGARDAADLRAADVSTSVLEREDGGVLGNIPLVSPLVEGAWDGIKDGAGWAADQVGLGGGKGSVVQLGRGEHASYPVSGRISSDMGMRHHPITGEARMHQGIDIAAREGTAIRAPASGEVIRSGHTGGRGNFVELRHADGSETRYFHMQSRPSLTQGDHVSAGDTLGAVGSTGRSTGPHLHYEIWKDGRALDPRRHLVRDGE